MRRYIGPEQESKRARVFLEIVKIWPKKDFDKTYQIAVILGISSRLVEHAGLTRKQSYEAFWASYSDLYYRLAGMKNGHENHGYSRKQC